MNIFGGYCTCGAIRTPEILKQLEGASKKSGLINGVDKRIQIHNMPDVGHWLHTENWPGVMELIGRESSCLS